MMTGKRLPLFLLALILNVCSATAQTDTAEETAPEPTNPPTSVPDTNVTQENTQKKGITSFSERFRKSRKGQKPHSYVQVADEFVNTSGMTGLEIGKEPSPEQLNNLKEDMVWIKQEEIGGYTILYPVVYLAPEHNQSEEVVTPKKEKK